MLFKSLGFYQNLNFSVLDFYQYGFSSSHFIFLPFSLLNVSEWKKAISRNLPHLSFFPKKTFKKNEKLKWKWENVGKLCIFSLKCTARMLCIQPVSASRLRYIHPTQTSLSVLNFHLTVRIPKTYISTKAISKTNSLEFLTRRTVS